MAPPIASIASRIERAAGRVAHARGQIVAVDHDHVGADRLQRLGQRAAAHHVDRADAVRLGEPDQVGADAGVGGVLDHPVARLQRHVVAQHQQRGRRIDLEHGELEHVGIRGHRERLRRRHLAPLAPVVAAEIDHAIARREALHVGADRGDPADALGAERRRQLRPHRVAAGDGQKVGRIDRERFDLDHHLVRAGRADVRHLDARGDLVRRAERRELHLLHGAPPGSARVCPGLDARYHGWAGSQGARLRCALAGQRQSSVGLSPALCMPERFRRPVQTRNALTLRNASARQGNHKLSH